MMKVRIMIKILALIIALVAINVVAIGRPEWVNHLISHLTVSVSLLGIAVIFKRGPRSLFVHWAGKVGPMILMTGIFGLFLGSIVEALAAVIEYPNDGLLHFISSQAVSISVILTCIGLLIVLFKRIRAAKRSGWIILIIIPIIFLVLFGLLQGFS